jgi:hypothetical protein
MALTPQLLSASLFSALQDSQRCVYVHTHASAACVAGTVGCICCTNWRNMVAATVGCPLQAVVSGMTVLQTAASPHAAPPAAALVCPRRPSKHAQLLSEPAVRQAPHSAKRNAHAEGDASLMSAPLAVPAPLLLQSGKHMRRVMPRLLNAPLAVPGPLLLQILSQHSSRGLCIQLRL